MKTFLSKQQIIDLVEHANSIMTSADYSRLKAIGRKYDIDLIHDRLTNLQLYWNKLAEKMDNLSPKDGFRYDLENRLIWNRRHSDFETMYSFIRYLNVWDEYADLCNLKWNELAHFSTSVLGSHGLPTEGGVSNMIKTGGDYFTYFSQFDKSNCDKDALKASEKLFNDMNLLFKGKNLTERHAIASAIMQHATSFDPMQYSDFHNSLNS